jgi:hypothetical protein
MIYIFFFLDIVIQIEEKYYHIRKLNLAWFTIKEFEKNELIM